MRTFKVAIAYNLFHHSGNKPFARCTVRVLDSGIRLSNWQIDEELLREHTKGGLVYDWTLANIQTETRKATERLLADDNCMKYPIRWNDETCLEHTFTETP